MLIWLAISLNKIFVRLQDDSSNGLEALQIHLICHHYSSADDSGKGEREKVRPLIKNDVLQVLLTFVIILVDSRQDSRVSDVILPNRI